MSAIASRVLGLSLASVVAIASARMHVTPANRDVVNQGAVAPRVDAALASEAVRTRTLVNVWREEGELAAMRRILADRAKGTHAIGHLAEEDFISRNPTWRKTAAANAPQNDVWRWYRGHLEGGQIKTHANGNAAEYMRDMLVDTKAEQFFVPDDHVKPLVQRIEQQIRSARASGNASLAATWERELARVRPLGRTYAGLKEALMVSARQTVQRYALKGAGRSAVVALAADGAVICYRCANGELSPMQTQAGGAEAVAKAGVLGLATYGVIIAGANAVGITVIVVGGVVYVLADYAISELQSSYASSPMTAAEIDESLPIGWRRDE